MSDFVLDSKTIARAHKVRLTASRSGNVSRRPVRRISAAICLAAALVIAAASVQAAGPSNDSWTIRIIPATKYMAAPPPPAEQMGNPGATYEPAPSRDRLPPPPAGAPNSRRPPMYLPPPDAGGLVRFTYSDAYRAIDFSRAEYEANPSYRHEAALGILFNQMPPMSIIKEAGVPSVPAYGYPTPQHPRAPRGNSMGSGYIFP